MKFTIQKRELLFVSIFLALSFSLSGCSFIGEIFKAGVQVGIFLVIILIIVIVVLINRFKKR